MGSGCSSDAPSQHSARSSSRVANEGKPMKNSELTSIISRPAGHSISDFETSQHSRRAEGARGDTANLLPLASINSNPRSTVGRTATVSGMSLSTHTHNSSDTGVFQPRLDIPFGSSDAAVALGIVEEGREVSRESGAGRTASPTPMTEQDDLLFQRRLNLLFHPDSSQQRADLDLGHLVEGPESKRSSDEDDEYVASLQENGLIRLRRDDERAPMELKSPETDERMRERCEMLATARVSPTNN